MVQVRDFQKEEYEATKRQNVRLQKQVADLRANPLKVELAWSSRAFNIGLSVGVVVGAISGITFAAWLFNSIH